MITKKQKADLLEKQYGCCALCRHRMSINDQACYDEPHNSVLCRRCIMLVAQVRKAIDRGLVLADIAVYEKSNVGIDRPSVGRGGG